MKSDFKQHVLSIVSNIARGSTMTYKEVAAAAGNPLAARAVGAILRKNFNDSIPCHRVIRSDGSMAGYNRGGTERKMQILLEELK